MIEQSSSQDEEVEMDKKRKKKLKPFPHCTDYTEWKKKNRI